MIRNFIINTIKKNFSYTPTNSQEKLIEKLADFLEETNYDKLLVINGYAGTGKTSIIASFVKTLWKIEKPVVLLAPTGRAAKMISKYAKASAFTIHRRIYRQNRVGELSSGFQLAPNMLKEAIYIVDEASMIANSSAEMNLFGTGRLLDDLIEHVYNSRNCKLILVGDVAQLPPVGLTVSPALDPKELERYGMPVFSANLSDVVRQGMESGILHNATIIRSIIKTKQFSFPQLEVGQFDDIHRLEGNDFVYSIEDSYGEHGIENNIIITRSNKSANIYNQGVRNQILYRESALEPGDLIMVVKNNYHWVREQKGIEFIANGDIAKIIRIYGEEQKYGCNFIDAKIQLMDNPEIEIELKINTDSLYSDYPALSPEQNQNLYSKIIEEQTDNSTQKKRFQSIKENEYYNALQIKFAYAITCHKAQGGQWDNVFVDHGYITEKEINLDFVRWLYTAVTRASKRLYFINFNKRFFGEEE